MLEQYRAELAAINGKIQKLQPKDAHVDAVSRSFHLGTVGGSGRNNKRLNKRREAYLNRAIEAAKKTTVLYDQARELERKIEKLEQEQRELADGTAVLKAQERRQKLEALAQWWRNLKPGDEIPNGNTNGRPLVGKKSAKSVTSIGGVKYKAAEIIGKEAAALL